MRLSLLPSVLFSSVIDGAVFARVFGQGQRRQVRRGGSGAAPGRSKYAELGPPPGARGWLEYFPEGPRSCLAPAARAKRWS